MDPSPAPAQKNRENKNRVTVGNGAVVAEPRRTGGRELGDWRRAREAEWGGGERG